MTEMLTIEDGRTVLRMERALAHPPEKVWRALTEPAELAHWFPAAVELDLRLYGRIAFTFDEDEDYEGSGVIRAYDPPRLLEFTWGEEIQRWELTPTDDGCLLRLTATYDDHAGSASFTSGWILCLDALDKSLGGAEVEREHYQVLHEHFVKVYHLDEGQVLDDGSVRFERQLTAPKEEVWARLAGAAEVAVGAAPPAGFVAKGIDPEPVETADEPTELTYGKISWKLRDGNGGARLVLTQTGPAADHLPAWHDLIESLAAELVD
jgi:uncharacterized protein YndB with AHSA1/START domain